MVSNANSLRAEAANFFKSLFTVDVWPPNRFPVHGCFPGLSSDATSSLDSVPSDQGIYSALMEMAALKVTAVCPTSIARTVCTPIWRAISNGWNDFLPNIAWSIGNGNAIDFLNDIWVHSLGPLRDHIEDPSLFTGVLSIRDFVTKNGTWNYNALHDLFPLSVVDRILIIKCPEQCDVDDRYMWR
ncbi:hypothetical protein V6N11_039647 [Hibiscus sabdariffa]|uniref:Uncharacterized protein n=1 Tax=Hibiscus sabdariffa TaxID=183260 RepID=A0ABR2SPB0_9ROSI